MCLLRQLILCLLLFPGMLTGCATSLQSLTLQKNPQWRNLHVNLSDIPFFAQEKYQCGPAALASMLSTSGVEVSPELLVPQLYIAAKNGSLPLEMIAVARTYHRVAYRLDTNLESIFQELKAGNPVLVFQNLGLNWLPQWHFAVVVGVDIPNNEITLHSGTQRFHRVGLTTFERTWNRAASWAYVILKPNTIPATATPEQYLYTISQHEQLQQFELAEQAIQNALVHWPNNRLLQMALGNNYYKQGKLHEAEKAFRTTLEMHPNYAVAHNNLAQTLLEQHKLSEALQFAKMAVAIGGQNRNLFQQTLAEIEAEIEAAMQRTP